VSATPTDVATPPATEPQKDASCYGVFEGFLAAPSPEDLDSMIQAAGGYDRMVAETAYAGSVNGLVLARKATDTTRVGDSTTDVELTVPTADGDKYEGWVAFASSSERLVWFLQRQRTPIACPTEGA
jgi:hypothetical protein